MNRSQRFKVKFHWVDSWSLLERHSPHNTWSNWDFCPIDRGPCATSLLKFCVSCGEKKNPPTTLKLTAAPLTRKVGVFHANFLNPHHWHFASSQVWFKISPEKTLFVSVAIFSFIASISADETGTDSFRILPCSSGVKNTREELIVFPWLRRGIYSNLIVHYLLIGRRWNKMHQIQSKVWLEKRRIA